MNLITFKTGITATLILLFTVILQINTMAGPPPWAPAHGYKAKTRYVYFPQQNIYYDLKKNVYIYPQGPSWSFGISLPTIFGNINLGSQRQVELYYYSENPEKYNKQHKTKYVVVNNYNTVKVKQKHPQKYNGGKGHYKEGKGKGKNK